VGGNVLKMFVGQNKRSWVATLMLNTGVCVCGGGAGYVCVEQVVALGQSWIPSSGKITPDTPTNASAIVYCNELATLMLNTGGLQQSCSIQVGGGYGIFW
jgi:hypothetical protein